MPAATLARVREGARCACGMEAPCHAAHERLWPHGFMPQPCVCVCVCVWRAHVVHAGEDLVGVLGHLILDVHLAAVLVLRLARERVVKFEVVRVRLEHLRCIGFQPRVAQPRVAA